MNVNEVETRRMTTSRESHGIDEFPDMSAIEEMSSFEQQSGIHDHVHVQYSMLENPHEEGDAFEINDSGEAIRHAIVSSNANATTPAGTSSVLANEFSQYSSIGQLGSSGIVSATAAAATKTTATTKPTSGITQSAGGGGSAAPILLSFSPILEVDDEASQRSHQRTISHQQSSAAASPAQSGPILLGKFSLMQDQLRKAGAVVISQDFREEEEEEKKNSSDQWNYRQMLNNGQKSHHGTGGSLTHPTTFASRLNKETATGSSPLVPSVTAATAAGSSKFQQQRNDILGQIERIQSIHQILDNKRASGLPTDLSQQLQQLQQLQQQPQQPQQQQQQQQNSVYVSPRQQYEENSVQIGISKVGKDTNKIDSKSTSSSSVAQEEKKQQQMTNSRLQKQLQLLEKQSNNYKRFLSGQMQSNASHERESSRVSMKNFFASNDSWSGQEQKMSSLQQQQQQQYSINQYDSLSKNTLDEIESSQLSSHRAKFLASPPASATAAAAATSDIGVSNGNQFEQSLLQKQQQRVFHSNSSMSRQNSDSRVQNSHAADNSSDNRSVSSQQQQGMRNTTTSVVQHHQRQTTATTTTTTSQLEQEQMIAGQLRECLSNMDEHKQAVKHYLDQTAQTQKYVMNVQDELLGKIQTQISDLRASLERFESILHNNINRTFTFSYDSLCTDQDALSSIADAIDEQYNQIIGFLAEKQPASQLAMKMTNIRTFIESTAQELEQHALKSVSDSSAIDTLRRSLRRSLRPILVALESAPSHLLFESAMKSIDEIHSSSTKSSSVVVVTPAVAAVVTLAVEPASKQYSTITQKSIQNSLNHYVPSQSAAHVQEYQSNNSLSHRSRGNSENVNGNGQVNIPSRGSLENQQQSKHFAQLGIEGSGSLSHRGTSTSSTAPLTFNAPSSGNSVSFGQQQQYQSAGKQHGIMVMHSYSPKGIEGVSYESIAVPSTSRTRGFLNSSSNNKNASNNNNNANGESNYRSNRSVDLFQSISLSSRKAAAASGSSDFSSAFRNNNNIINSSSSNIHGYESLPRSSHLKHTLSIHEITPNTTVMLGGTHAAVFSPTKFNSLNSGSLAVAAAASAAVGSLTSVNVKANSGSASLKEINKKQIVGQAKVNQQIEKGMLLSPSGASNRLFERAQKKQAKVSSGFFGSHGILASESKGLGSPSSASSASQSQFNRKGTSLSSSSSTSTQQQQMQSQLQGASSRSFISLSQKQTISRISPKRENSSHKEIFESSKSNPVVYDKILTNLNKYRDLYASAKRAFFESPSPLS